MDSVDIRYAKTNLSRLIRMVEKGDDIVICRAGIPVARLTGLSPQMKPRTLGLMKGMIWMAADFDAPLPEGTIDAFEET